MNKILFAAVLLVPLAACQAITRPNEPDLHLVTSETAFALDPTAHIPFAITNRGRATAYISTCGDRIMAAIDREEGGVWMQYSGDACLTVFPMGPVTIAPGETIQGGRSIREPGRYRFRIGVSRVRGAELRWSTVSNAFTVE